MAKMDSRDSLRKPKESEEQKSELLIVYLACLMSKYSILQLSRNEITTIAMGALPSTPTIAHDRPFVHHSGTEPI